VLLSVGILLLNIGITKADKVENNFDEIPIRSISNTEEYKIEEIIFPQLDEIILTKKYDSISVEEFINIKNIENISKIKLFIKELNLEKYGQKHLEKTILEELESLKNSGYIEKYQLYIPKEESKNSILSTTSPSYYGTSNNREFRHFFSVYFDSYQKTSYNDNKHKQWAKGLIDFSLIFAPKTLNIAYFALSATNRSDIISFETDNIRYDGSDEVTRHYITIQDITNTMGGGTDAFFVTIVDEARVNTTDAVIDYVSPTKKTVTDNISYMESVLCSTWSNSKSSQMQRGYNQWLIDPGAPVYNLVGRFSIPW